ncbi:ATP-binding protein [Escherichia phage SECphi27]|uniref:ATP-binding protein n=1 Tax=Escherichia phage SECphi27 TaxID=2496550 RepID=UPI0018AD5D34|nr:ATP-binding protein [Escherichia phage SECphi27]
MKRDIIILNGPPGCGKDTIAAYLTGHRYPAVKASFKQPMFDIAFSMLGVYRYDEFMDLYNDREQKEKPQVILGGKSPRQFMIWISEDVMKPVFGEQYFGRRMVEEINEMYRDLAVVISDGGFPEEIKPLVKAGHEVHICRLHRDGFTFAGDSRDYIDLSGYHYRIHHYDFHLQEGKPELAVSEIVNAVKWKHTQIK